MRAAILLRDECAGCYQTSIICADAAMVGNGGAEAVRTAFEMYGYALACTSCLPDNLRADMVESDIRRDAGITMLELTRFLQSLFGKAK